MYLEFATPRKKPTTLAADRPRFAVIKREPWSKLPLREIQRNDVARFAARLTKQGPRGKPCAGSTVNRYLASISALFRWAIREGYASTNPAHDVDRFSERGTAREMYLEASEARALVEACSEQFRPIVAFALGTGCSGTTKVERGL